MRFNKKSINKQTNIYNLIFKEPGTRSPLQFLARRLCFAPPPHCGIFSLIGAIDKGMFKPNRFSKSVRFTNTAAYNISRKIFTFAPC
ncbi:hypothetical protein HMPREF0204_10507 [Chryseobacterium gleum ATCC 35910]|uniref:Uncharacterized protein n=1 Tax=Chryseobacterium gleum ATCC 35910 TaxID=525257 RepID=A0ABN0AX66_CHRGE|nr:hypothetical protein HMPREF0204_10507 [Chryseobacterium gleum ATCC 35910]